MDSTLVFEEGKKESHSAVHFKHLSQYFHCKLIFASNIQEKGAAATTSDTEQKCHFE
jgi:hypothetical protein